MKSSQTLKTSEKDCRASTKDCKISKKGYRIVKEYLDSYLAVSEIGFDFKIIPKLKVIR